MTDDATLRGLLAALLLSASISCGPSPAPYDPELAHRSADPMGKICWNLAAVVHTAIHREVHGWDVGTDMAHGTPLEREIYGLCLARRHPDAGPATLQGCRQAFDALSVQFHEEVLARLAGEPSTDMRDTLVEMLVMADELLERPLAPKAHEPGQERCAVRPATAP